MRAFPFRFYGIAAADFDLDGRIEVAATGERIENNTAFHFLRVWEIAGDGMLSASFDELDLPPNINGGLTAADFNGDGVPDLSINDNSISLFYPGSGDESLFLTPGSYSGWNSAVTPFDVDSDGDVDLVRHFPINIIENVLEGDRAQPERTTFDPVFNLPNSISDGLGRETLFERDPTTGNVLTEVRVVGALDTIANGEKRRRRHDVHLQLVGSSRHRDGRAPACDRLRLRQQGATAGGNLRRWHNRRGEPTV